MHKNVIKHEVDKCIRLKDNLLAEQSRAEQSRAEQSLSFSRRFSWLDILKGIGIILVLIGHIYSNDVVYTWLYSFHMPLFFVAAGCLYREKPILTDVKRRIQTIVIPYLSFGFVILVYWQLIERRFRESYMSFGGSFLGLLSGEYQYLDFNVHLWFLPCFFVTVVVFNALVLLGDSFKIGKRLAYIVSVMMSIVLILTDNAGLTLPDMLWGFDRTFKYIGFYAVGCVLHEHKIDGVVRKNLRGNPSSASVICVAVLLAINFGLSYAGLTTGVMWFVTALTGVAAVTIMAMLIDHNRMLEYFGRVSFVILCVHGPVYRVIVKIVSILVGMSTDAVRENVFLAMFVVALALAVCNAVYEVVIRIAPWMVGKSRKSA